MKRIIVNNISKKFKIGFRKKQSTLSRIISHFSGRESKKTMYAVKNVSFYVSSGEILGIIGNNGAGKTTLLRILAGIYPNYQGSKKIIGKIIPLIDLGRGLNERLTMTENIFLLGSFFGLSQKEIKKKINSIIKLTDLQKFVNTKLYQFSNGMKTRLAFSIAMHCGPDILLLDEVFAVGDENFRLTSAEKIKRIVKKGGSVIFVSHELQMIEKYCDRVIIMDKGRIIALGKPREMIEKLKNKAIPSSS